MDENINPAVWGREREHQKEMVEEGGGESAPPRAMRPKGEESAVRPERSRVATSSIAGCKSGFAVGRPLVPMVARGGVVE